MLNTVYVKVVGFRDSERHALNTVFRLSHDRSTQYVPWTANSPRMAQLLLLDVDSYEASVELASPAFNKNLTLIAVGEKPPEFAWRSFPRPLNWTAVVHAMDQLFAGAVGADIDLDTGLASQGITPPGVRQTLLVDVSRENRLYLRARLALAGLLDVAEASSASDAFALASERHFSLVIINLDAPDLDGWNLVERLVALEPSIGSIILTSKDYAWHLQERAEQAGCAGMLEVPFDPMQIVDLLRKV
jgi:CheY-like chemotaxis protein